MRALRPILFLLFLSVGPNLRVSPGQQNVFPPPVGGGGGGSGTVTSVTFGGTANQITVTGTCTITVTGTCTLSFPAGGVTLPATTTGTFSGNLTGNVTGNVTGTSGSATGNAASATVLATTRAIYGNNFDGSAALAQVIAPSFGGTNSAFYGVAGFSASIKTHTWPNVSVDFSALTGVMKMNGASAPGVVAGTATDCVLVNGTSGPCGAGSGTVTSVGLVGTANQLTVTGASPITGSGSWTISIPTSPTLPGTTTGTFSGNLTGNVTGNASGTAATFTGALIGDVTSSGMATTVAAGVVTLAKMANIATASFIGRTTAATGVPEALTVTQATAMLNACSATVKGLVPTPPNNTTTFLRGDCTFAAPAGSGTVTVVGAGSLTSTALVTGGGTTTLQTPAATATMDSSGNISTPGTYTSGAGTTAGGSSVYGNPTGDTAASFVEINSGDGASNAEPASLGLWSSHTTKRDAWLFPCTDTDGVLCIATAKPTADASNFILTTNNTATLTGKSISGAQISSAVAAATALAANGGNCSGNNFALGVDASGVCEGAQPAFSNLSGAATDAQVPDTITASNYLPLVGGTLTGQLITDNLAIEFEESDTNPSCGAGNYNIYADLSETALKMCNNGVASVLGAGGSGITTLNTLTGATQTFATPGTTGTAPNWVSSGTSHTMHIPLASAAGVTAGLVTKAWWDTVVLDSTLGGLLSGVYPTLAGPNTFTGNNIMTPTATTQSVRLVPSTRPSAPGAGALNVSAAGEFEWYDGSAWQVAGTAAGAPTNATYITQTANGSLSAEQALSALATGILKNTTTTGVLSIAVAGDFPTLNQNTTGLAATATVLATTRSIYGNNFDGSAALAQVIAPTYGGTNSAFFGIAGPASSIKTWTIWNASLDWTGLTGVAKLNGASLPGVVTGTATDCVLVNGTSGACGSGGGGVSAKTGNYTTVGGDTGTLITFDGSSLTATLLATPSSTYVVGIKNLNATALTVSRNGLTINGGTSDIVLQRYQDVACYADGTNYFCEVPTVAGSNITLTPASNGMTIAAAGGGGTVTASGTPLISQLAVWTTATDIKGIAVGANNTVLRGSTGADPAFGSLVDADIPNTITVDLASAATVLATTRAIYGNNFDGSAAITGPVGIAFGGTGTASTLTGLVRGSASAMTAAELSGDCVTSGSNAVVCSQINGNNFTVSSAGLLTKISGLTTTGVGVPIVLFSTDVTAQSTSQGAVTIATSPAAGVYRISYYADMTTACTTGSNSVSFTFNWTDSGGARNLTTGSMPMGASQWVGAYLSGGPFQISVASGDITYTSTVLGTCASGTSTYEIRPVLERVK